MATTTEKWSALGTQTTVISAASVTNNSNKLGSAYNNTQGNTGDGYTLCRVTATLNYSVIPTANTGVPIWFLRSPDGGTTYEGGDDTTPYTPPRPSDWTIPVPTIATNVTAQPVVRDMMLPAGFFKTLARNDGTGQTCTITITITPITRQSV